MDRALTVMCGLGLTVAVACNGDGPQAGGSATAGQTGGIELTEGSLDDQGSYEVGGGETENGGDCPGGGGAPGGEYEFSYIWIANSPDGTVSKINTFTGVEEGRFITGPDNPDPSRTSVNQFGDVAVANRNGGIAKIAASVDDCIDQNGDGTIQTSTGPGTVLAWGEDECVLWYQDLPASGGNGPRPIAWEPVETSGGCTAKMPRVWVGFWRGQNDDVGVFRRLDGASGALLDEVEVATWGLTDRDRGPYGGAVNKAGDFWVTGYYGPAIRIDASTLAVDYYPPPDGSGFYGMAMDANENMWIGGCDGALYHFDAQNEQFETIATIEGRARGVQVDTEGRAWFAGNNPCRLLMVDVATKTLVDDNIALPGCGEPVGVSIDVEGFVWVVDMGAEQAYKVDPDTHQVDLQVTGLVGPYTYSDMTGAGLGLVANPPAG